MTDILEQSWSWDVYVVLALIGWIAGIFVGAVAVGGILIVPLALLSGHDAKIAVASNKLAYLAAGTCGTYLHFKGTDMSIVRSLPTLLWSVPGSVAGVFLVELVDANTIKLVLGALILISSAITIFRDYQHKKQSNKSEIQLEVVPGAPDGQPDRPINATMLIAAQSSCRDSQPSQPARQEEPPEEGGGGSLRRTQHTEGGPPPSLCAEVLHSCSLIQAVNGLFTGVLSTLTGSSGPVVLLPLLLLANWKTREAVACAQAVQIPLAVAGTISFYSLTPELMNEAYGTVVGLSMSVGIFMGHKYSRAWNSDNLKRTVITLLILCGLYILIDTAIDL